LVTVHREKSLHWDKGPSFQQVTFNEFYTVEMLQTAK